MKTTTFVLALALACTHLRAETDVCSLTTDGLVNNQTWTLAGSPYVVRCDLFVNGLTIDLGVQVVVDGSFGIEVTTTLKALGSADASITFTSSNPTSRWRGLFFHDTPGGSELRHCVVELASESGVRVVDAIPPVLDHCVFRNNTTDGFGGAVNVSGLLENLQVTDCVFEGNTSASHGGAMRLNLLAGVTANLVDCTFRGNTANPTGVDGDYAGGAIFIEDGNVVVTGTAFRENLSNSYCAGAFGCNVVSRAGALYMGGTGSLIVQSSEFEGNQSQASNAGDCFFGGTTASVGAGLHVEGGTVNVANSIFTGNRTPGSDCRFGAGGASITVFGGDVTVTNSTFAREPDTSALYHQGGTLSVTNSILFFNNGGGPQIDGPVDVTYSCVEGGFPGTGNIRFNPAFAGPDAEAADLRIRPGSPCIDAGDPNGPQDACLPPSLGTLRNDLGAHGGPGACELAGLDCNENLIDDREELSQSSGLDCNANGILDACDIASGTLADANSDGIPDDCAARSVRLVPVAGGGSICYDVVLKINVPALGGELSIVVDPAVLDVLSVADSRAGGGRFATEPAAFPVGPLLTCPGGSPAGFRIFWAVPDGAAALASGEHTLARICVAYKNGAPPGRCSPIAFSECLGAPGTPARNVITGTDGRSLLLRATTTKQCPVTFRRGDANSDGLFDASDPIVILACLFSGSPCPSCADAADANDDGANNISDAVYLISWRFQKGPQPPSPFPGCDRDVAADSLPDCSVSSCP